MDLLLIFECQVYDELWEQDQRNGGIDALGGPLLESEAITSPQPRVRNVHRHRRKFGSLLETNRKMMQIRVERHYFLLAFSGNLDLHESRSWLQ